MVFILSLQTRQLTAYDVDIDSLTHDELLTLTSQIHQKSRAPLVPEASTSDTQKISV